MAFPAGAYTYLGGCNCRAIRYRVSLPDASLRPPNPYGTSAPPEKLPMIAICHCNDCRRSHGQAFGFAAVHALEWVSYSFTSPSTPANDNEWIPATTIFDSVTGPDESMDAIIQSTLRFFHSSKGRARGFCNRCGTPLLYFVFAPKEKLPETWVPQLDIWAGTIDREYLQEQWFRPSRELWCDFGLGWGLEVAAVGTGEATRCGRFSLETQRAEFSS